MSPIVIDNSIVLAWCMADESHPMAERAMQTVVEHGAVVPAIWWYELRNVLIVNERRSRLTPADTQAILSDLRDLNITIDQDHDETAILELARKCKLSIYDAAYLEVARRLSLPLATLDKQLKHACKKAEVKCVL